MVYAKLAYLAFIACICQVADGQSVRRVRPGCAVPQLVPRAPAPCRPNGNNLGARYRYENNLEEIISKLVNALIYTVLQKDGSGAGGSNGGSVGGNGGGAGGGGAGGGKGNGGAGNGGSGSTGFLNSLLDLEVALDGMNVLDLGVLPGNSGNGSSEGQNSDVSTNDLISLVRQLLRLVLG